MRKTLAFGVLTVLLAATNAFAGAEARINGKVVDASSKQPIANAVVKLEAIEGKTVKQEAKTKADGTYALFILDGTLQYKITWSAAGYTPYEETMKLKIGEPNKKDVELGKGGGLAGGGKGAAPQPDPAATAYNEGAQLANAGKNAEAIAKFEEAIKLKATFTPALTALAKTHFKMKNYAKAIEAGEKVVEIDDEDSDMWALLEKAYSAAGNKDKAAEARKHAPANPAQLFNDAAALINKGNDSDAEPLLKKAIAADEAMARAYYELGMIYVRAGKADEAKANLSKYLELDPKGADAPTAKEMLSYLK
jgi:tetratricopeptide (TPR) repeat protein